MAQRLTVKEASGAYEAGMRSVLPAGPGVCSVCHTFVADSYDTCLTCGAQPTCADVVVPITYSVHLGQIHTALRNYKDSLPASVQRYAMVRLTAILWRFLSEHEGCIARAAGAGGFNLVTTVPSSSPERDGQRANLRTMVSWCGPLKDRYRRVLRATGQAPPGRGYDEGRYAAEGRLGAAAVLLIDDTWASGGHVQSAVHALRKGGASRVGVVVIGRHIRPEWKVGEEEMCSDRLESLPERFDWATCAVH